MKTFGNTSEVLAVVSLYSPPNEYLLRLTYDTLCVCEYQGEDAVLVVSVTSIISVVAMVPFPFLIGGRNNQFFMIEKIGLDVAGTDSIVDTEDDL